jgi:hypothetical protein
LRSNVNAELENTDEELQPFSRIFRISHQHSHSLPQISQLPVS